MTWELIKQDEAKERTIYKVGSYQVLVYGAEYKHGGYEIMVRTPADERFAPDICLMDEFKTDGMLIRTVRQTIGIQTTSYGSLKPEEIKEVIRWYEIAMEVAESIKERYPMCF